MLSRCFHFMFLQEKDMKVKKELVQSITKKRLDIGRCGFEAIYDLFIVQF